MEKLKENKGFDIVDTSQGMTVMDVDMTVEQSEADLIVVDACYRIKAGGKVKDRMENMAMVADDLKGIAQRHGRAIVATTQLNRNATKNPDGGVEDMALSDVLGWIGTNVFRMNQTKEQRANHMMEFKPLKIREGDGESRSLLCKWDLIGMNFDQMENKKKEQKAYQEKADEDDDF